MRWAHRDLHDSLLAAGVAVPPVPSMRNYLASLHAQYGDADAGFLPQSLASHQKIEAAGDPPDACARGHKAWGPAHRLEA
eukprot:7630057-Alexandrium_andersonii.AAC.1